jgi:hypothetical protein
MLDRVGGGGMERLEHLPADSASGMGPHGRRVLSGRPDAGRDWLGRPSSRYPGNDSTQLARSYETNSMDSELLEVRTMDLTPLGYVQVGGLRPPQRPLDHRMRNAKALRKGSIRPVPIANE